MRPPNWTVPVLLLCKCIEPERTHNSATRRTCSHTSAWYLHHSCPCFQWEVIYHPIRSGLFPVVLTSPLSNHHYQSSHYQIAAITSNQLGTVSQGCLLKLDWHIVFEHIDATVRYFTAFLTDAAAQRIPQTSGLATHDMSHGGTMNAELCTRNVIKYVDWSGNFLQRWTLQTSSI